MFVNAALDEVAGTTDALGLTMVQLHGDEGPAFCAEVARRTGAKVVKAARVRSRADVQALRAVPHRLPPARRPPPRPLRRDGGDLRLGAGGGAPLGTPLILSGGLTPRERRRPRSRPSGPSRSTPRAARRRPRESRTPTKLRAFAAAVQGGVVAAGT